MNSIDPNMTGSSGNIDQTRVIEIWMAKSVDNTVNFYLLNKIVNNSV